MIVAPEQQIYGQNSKFWPFCGLCSCPDKLKIWHLGADLRGEDPFWISELA